MLMGWVLGGVVLVKCVDRPALPLVMWLYVCRVSIGLGPSIASLGTFKAQGSRSDF